MSVKCSLFCPPEGTAPALNHAGVKFPVAPVVGDVLYVPQLAPPAGCGAGLHHFRVVERMVSDRGVHLNVRHVRDREDAS